MKKKFKPTNSSGRSEHHPSSKVGGKTDRAPRTSDKGTTFTKKPEPWKDLPGFEALELWAAALQRARETGTSEEWRLTGRGLLLLTDNAERCGPALLRAATEAGFELRTLTLDHEGDAPELLPHAENGPVILWLQPGPWQFTAEAANQHPTALPNQVGAFQSALAGKIATLPSNLPLVMVACAESESNFTELLRLPGAFDRCAELPKPSALEKGVRFLDEVGQERCHATLLAASGKVGYLVGHWFDESRRRELAVLGLHRRHRDQGRLIELQDIFDLALRGAVETGAQPPTRPGPSRHSVAVHEAGHAVVAILDSGGANFPDYCTVMPSTDFEGVVVGSLAYRHAVEQQLTYERFRHDIRVSLAGRAAEEVVFGAEKVSNGCSADLESCTRRCMLAFSRFGFAPEMAAPGSSGSNLAVAVGEPTPGQRLHFDSLTRTFLANEYRAVIDLLNRHRPLLDAVADRLGWDPVVDQSELRQLCLQLDIPLTTLSA